jgi:predicted MFS family arabinose efflux permease
LTFAPAGRLWAVEHGPRGGDELTLIEKGQNYGWLQASKVFTLGPITYPTLASGVTAIPAGTVSFIPFVFVAGTAMVITGVGAQTLIQASVEPQMRGRVMALYGMIFRAGPALGAVLMGSLSERFGLRLPLAVGAVISVVVCALTWARQRRIAPLLESEPPSRGQGGSAVEKGAR